MFSNLTRRCWSCNNWCIYKSVHSTIYFTEISLNLHARIFIKGKGQLKLIGVDRRKKWLYIKSLHCTQPLQNVWNMTILEFTQWGAHLHLVYFCKILLGSTKNVGKKYANNLGWCQRLWSLHMTKLRISDKSLLKCVLLCKVAITLVKMADSWTADPAKIQTDREVLDWLLHI